MRGPVFKIDDKLSAIEANTRPTDEQSPEFEKTCPRCGETVKSAATMCRFCSYQFDQASIVSPVSVVLLDNGQEWRRIPFLLVELGLANNVDEGIDACKSLPSIISRQTNPERAQEIKKRFAEATANVEVLDQKAADELIAVTPANTRTGGNGCAIVFIIVVIIAGVLAALWAFDLFSK